MTKYTKRWRNTQKFEWMTDKVADDDYKVIPWIASSKSSDQKHAYVGGDGSKKHKKCACVIYEWSLTKSKSEECRSVFINKFRIFESLLDLAPTACSTLIDCSISCLFASNFFKQFL